MEQVTQVYEAVFGSVNATSGLNSAINLFPVVVATFVGLAALVILFYVSSSIERFRKFKRLVKILKYLSKSLSYAAYGGLTVVIIVGPCLLIYHTVQTTQANAESILPLLKWVGIAIGAYVGLTALGWFMKKRVWSKISKYHREEKQIKETMKELPIGRG